MIIKINLAKNKDLKKIVNNYEKYFIYICNTINLPKKWNKKKAFEIEIKKSFIRGLLRYSENSYKILQFLKKKYYKDFLKSKKINWLTLPYPMIHLSKDNVEDGGYHYDDCSNKNYYTCWIPITDYNYSALSMLNFQSKIINKIFTFLIKTGICKYFSHDINAKKGNIFFWNGIQIHSGKKNISKIPSCAIQLKLVNEVYKFEQNKNINYNFYKKNKNFKNLNKKDILIII